MNFYNYYSGELNFYDKYNPLIVRAAAGRLGGIDFSPILHIIKKNPKLAFRHAQRIIKGRWYEAEPYIMKDPNWACEYAMHILKERWYEAEPVIMKSTYWWYTYKKWFNI